MTFPKFRIPTWAEFCALFLANKDVAGAVHSITAAIQRLDDVILHHSLQADTKLSKAAALRDEANALHAEVDSHDTEADHAAEVQAKLAALVA